MGILHLDSSSICLEFASFASLILSSEDTRWGLLQQCLQQADVTAAAVLHGTLKILDLGLRSFIGEFTLRYISCRMERVRSPIYHHGIQEIYAPERSSNNRKHGLRRSGQFHHCSSTNMWKDPTFTKFNKSKFHVI